MNNAIYVFQNIGTMHKLIVFYDRAESDFSKTALQDVLIDESKKAKIDISIFEVRNYDDRIELLLFFFDGN